MAARTRNTPGLALAGSIAVQAEGGVYNRLLFATPRSHHYDKRHLFRMAGSTTATCPGLTGLSSGGAAGASSCRCAMTCASRYSAAIARTTTSRCMSPTGRLHAGCTGASYWWPGRSKTRLAWWG